VFSSQAFARFKRPFIERRRSVREQVQFQALIEFGGGSRPLNCTVMDVSEGGARIKVASPAQLPKDFWLVLTKDRMKRRQCQMVWHSKSQIGVKYLGDVHTDFFPPVLK
jgi:PilZ domain